MTRNHHNARTHLCAHCGRHWPDRAMEQHKPDGVKRRYYICEFCRSVVFRRDHPNLITGWVGNAFGLGPFAWTVENVMADMLSNCGAPFSEFRGVEREKK